MRDKSFLRIAPWYPPQVTGGRLIGVTYYDPFVRAFAVLMAKQTALPRGSK